MLENHEYYVVDKLAVPSVLLKTIQVKQLLEKNPGLKISDAVKQVDLSRSAFYKYKDLIFPYNSLKATRMVTFFMELSDVAGILSQILRIIANYGANVLTINQNIPMNGKTNISISIDTTSMEKTLDSLEKKLRSIEDISKFTIIISE
ncbi:MAG: ACT domain-containing protein [Clostridia bacterium]|nr:ACT domain-containing protein [Clostridia bacterium]